jgi:excisionase family DNA binding protein
MTLTQLAADLKVSERTVYRLLGDGCPHLRVRKQIRFDPIRVREWMECRYEKTKPVTGTSRFATNVSGFTNAFQRVRLRTMPSGSKPKSA